MSSSVEFFSGINYALLAEQKLTLLQLAEAARNEAVAALARGEAPNRREEHLEGVINLIDALQEHAADDLGLHVVWLMDEEEEE